MDGKLRLIFKWASQLEFWVILRDVLPTRSHRQTKSPSPMGRGFLVPLSLSISSLKALICAGVSGPTSFSYSRGDSTPAPVGKLKAEPLANGTHFLVRCRRSPTPLPTPSVLTLTALAFNSFFNLRTLGFPLPAVKKWFSTLADIRVNWEHF